MFATKVSERVYLIDTVALGQTGTVAAYAIKGPRPTLIDCSYASSFQNVLDGLSEIGIAPSDVRYLVPTHVHLDHAGAAGHLAKEFPNAEVIAHERAVPHLENPTRLIESATRVFGAEMMALYGTPIPIPSARITPVGEEARLDLGDGLTATLTHSPGHAPHQIAVMLEEERTLLTADAVGILYPGMKTMIPTTPPPSLDPKMLVATAERLAGMDPELLLLPHFGVRKDPKFVFEQTMEKTDQWLGKTAGMRDRGMSLDEITDAMIEHLAGQERTSELPIYVRVSVKTSVMGIAHYLEKNA